MKKYKIVISEPWDFVGPDGENLIKGTILKRLDENNRIFKSNHPITFREGEGDMFFIAPRVLNAKTSDLKSIVNGGLFLGKDISGLSAKEIENQSKFVFIGDIYEE